MMVIITETLTSTSHHDIFTYLDYIFSCYLHTVGFYPYLLSYIYIYIYMCVCVCVCVCVSSLSLRHDYTIFPLTPSLTYTHSLSLFFCASVRLSHRTLLVLSTSSSVRIELMNDSFYLVSLHWCVHV